MSDMFVVAIVGTEGGGWGWAIAPQIQGNSDVILYKNRILCRFFYLKHSISNSKNGSSS